jgi:hypothetical protein
MDLLEQLITQVTSLSWLRCAMEEGVSFVNKHTGEPEDNEIVIYKNLEQKSGAFDLPAAKCSPKCLEKNVLEVVGTLLVYNKNPDVAQQLSSPAFAIEVNQLIEKIRNS